MTEEEFQAKYHEFSTTDWYKAKAEADSITMDDGNHPVVVGFPIGLSIQYCLMLPKSAKFIKELYS